MFFSARGTLRGHYVNLIRPPRLEGPAPDGTRRWVIDDLYLDVWIPAAGAPKILDQDELDRACARGWVSGDEKARVEGLAARIVRDAGRPGRAWPPSLVRRWPPDLVPALRVRRDSPGTFHAARISGRIIAYGLYLFHVESEAGTHIGKFAVIK